MESITDYTVEIQKRVSEFGRGIGKKGLSRPEAKNVTSGIQAMLKVRDAHVMGLARALGEKISPKKTWERLSRSYRKDGMWKRVLEGNMALHEGQIRKKRYCIIDVSDIRKDYSRKMEGLGRVRDGSRKEIVDGYWWINAVMADSGGIMPVYGEVYSLEEEGREHASENVKVLGIIDRVGRIHSGAVFVMDRGGDRGKLLKPMLAEGKKFVVRCQGLRDVKLHADSERTTNIKKVAGRIRPLVTCESVRKRKMMFEVGVRRVYLDGHALWLVASRQKGEKNGLSWYLTNVEGNRHEVIATVMEAYGLRWRVEEYHRQIKQDYHLEAISLRTYQAIKTMGVIVMLAAMLCARLPESLTIKLLAATNLLPRKRLSDIPQYPFYMISEAVALALAASIKRRPQPLHIRKRDYFQLKLNLVSV